LEVNVIARVIIRQHQIHEIQTVATNVSVCHTALLDFGVLKWLIWSEDSWGSRNIVSDGVTISPQRGEVEVHSMQFFAELLWPFVQITH